MFQKVMVCSFVRNAGTQHETRVLPEEVAEHGGGAKKEYFVGNAHVSSEQSDQFL
jgi:hypothetical protein